MSQMAQCQILSLPWRLEIHLRYLWFAGERHDPGVLGWCGGLRWLGRHTWISWIFCLTDELFPSLKSWTYWDASRKLQRVTRATFIYVVADQDLHSPSRATRPVEQTWASRIGVGPGADKEIRNDKETVLVKLDSGIYPVAVCYSTLI